MKHRMTTWGGAALLGMAATAMTAPQEVVPTVQEVPTVEIPTVEVQEGPRTPDTQGARAIDLVICLDTSGSMSGLLDSCRQKLWAIVNDLALAEPTPRLRVALLTFGNDGHQAEEGWVFVQTPFTEDLDLVSQKLFEQTTNGGTELVGRVMKKALDVLKFDPDPDTLKLMFVAGNESADQDQEVSFRDMCSSAIARDIMVNSIYCGNPADDIAPGWKEVATRADGHFAAIDQDHGTVVIETPFDEELAALSAGINGTYVPLGEEGMLGCQNQWAQDANAASLNRAAVAQRAQTKGGKLYKVDWDLCNLVNDQRVDLTKLKQEELPEELRGMTVEEQKAYVEKKLAERAVFQKQIEELSQKRQGFVEAALREQSLQSNDAFDHAVRRAIRAQATTKGFEFQPLPELPPQPETPANDTNDTQAPGTGNAVPVPVLPPPAQGGQVLLPAGQRVQVLPTQQGQVRQGQVVAPPAQQQGVTPPPAQQGQQQGGQVKQEEQVVPPPAGQQGQKQGQKQGQSDQGGAQGQSDQNRQQSGGQGSGQQQSGGQGSGGQGGSA